MPSVPANPTPDARLPDWDDIPDRLPGGGRHAIRVDWFTTIPRHTISVTADRKGPIELLVVPPDTLRARRARRFRH